jgi:hypothetical protein
MKISLQDIINRIKEVLISPKAFWNSYKENNVGFSELFGGFFLPVLLVAVLAVFLGEFFKSAHFYMVFAILKALRELVLFILEFFIAIYFTNELLKTFGGEKNIRLSRLLVTYSFTPFLLVSTVTGLFPFLYPLDILGVYGFYIFWVGGKQLLTLPQQKIDSYLILTIVVNFITFGFASIILSKLLTYYY